MYGTEGLAADVGLLQTSVPILYALAIRRLVQKKPERFGSAADLDEYDAEVTRLRSELDQACANMRAAVSGADLEIEYEGLPANLRDQDLAKPILYIR